VGKNTRPVSVSIRVEYECHPRVKKCPRTHTHRVTRTRIAIPIDYSTCVEQLKIARAKIIEINSMHSTTYSSTLNNDTCIDSNDNYDILLDINICSVSTIDCVSCIDLKHEIDDFKQVRDDMSVKLVEHNEKSVWMDAGRSRAGAESALSAVGGGTSPLSSAPSPRSTAPVVMLWTLPSW
jgi:hypothetical protein